MPSSDLSLDRSIGSDFNIMATVADVGSYPPYTQTAYGCGPAAYGVFDNGTVSPSLSDIPTPPMLLPGNGEVREIIAEARVELNIIALSASLAASVILMMLAMASLRSPNEDDDLPLDGTGILHAIWLYRNHPEIEARLEQVEHPTDENLRAAGMMEIPRMYERKYGTPNHNDHDYDESIESAGLSDATSEMRFAHPLQRAPPTRPLLPVVARSRSTKTPPLTPRSPVTGPTRLRARPGTGGSGGMQLDPNTIFPSPPNSYNDESMLSMSVLSNSVTSTTPLRRA
ncbi:hypothetical protein B0H14DRAFT_3461989 [Mycena olivaceomarginata]|nr:hypothetical protein B0H14DRAFT_3461989 [Mycena olivaceomarginata]